MNRLPLVALLVLCASAEEFQIEANIRYSQSQQTVLDILQPRAPALKDRAAAILIPPKFDSKESAAHITGQAFIDHGWVVVSIDYRADEAQGDSLKAIEWFARHAAMYRVDPKRIVVCGGDLARVAATQENGIAAIIQLNHALAPPTGGYNGKPAILSVDTDTVPESVFQWLKKQKIQ